jgi:hypothetical protein
LSIYELPDGRLNNRVQFVNTKIRKSDNWYVTQITDPLFKVSVSLNTLGKGRTMARSLSHIIGVLQTLRP